MQTQGPSWGPSNGAGFDAISTVLMRGSQPNYGSVQHKKGGLTADQNRGLQRLPGKVKGRRKGEGPKYSLATY